MIPTAILSNRQVIALESLLPVVDGNIVPPDPSLATTKTTLPGPNTGNLTNLPAIQHFDESEKIGVGIAIPFAPLSLAAFIWRKRRLRSVVIAAEEQQSAETKQDETVMSEGDKHPFFQQKSKLEAEERPKYELEARQGLHELDGEAEIHEIPAGVDQHFWLS